MTSIHWTGIGPWITKHMVPAPFPKIGLKFWRGETLGEQNFPCTSFMSCLGEELSQNYDKTLFYHQQGQAAERI